MSIITLEASVFWSKEPTDLQTCTGCKQVIYSEVYTPILQIGPADHLDFQTLEFKLCESCYGITISSFR